jgi:general secretion pathway protein D
MNLGHFCLSRRIACHICAALSFTLIAGCAMREEPFIPVPIMKAAHPQYQDAPLTRYKHAQQEEDTQQEDGTNFYQTPKPPPAIRTSVGRPAAPPVVDTDDAIATITLDNLPLPQFINVIYGSILKRNVSMDTQVSKRTEMVTFRTGKPQSAIQIFTAAQALLRSYGIAVYDYDGTLRVTPENNQAGMLPEIRRGKASPDVPSSLRPVFFLAELEHVQPSQVSNWLKTLFQSRLTIQDDNTRNALLLSGQSDTVAAAMEAIQMLDQPVMRGRLSVRITPVFWSADEMAKRLVEVLQAEGYAVTTQANANSPTLVMPIGPINSIIVFASSEQVLNHALYWAQELDQSPRGRTGNFIHYHVRNTDAAELAKTLGEIMGMTGGGGGSSGGGNASKGKVVVNPTANSIIIQTTPSEFQQWHSLLQELDRPAKNALIMATVAEVSLNNNEIFGFQWLVKQFMSHGYAVNLGTTNSVGTSASANTFRIGIASGSDPRALLTLLATTDKIKILSNPSVMARNGQAATIQVGDEIPILTSQLSAGNTDTTSTGSSTSILQSVQYRSTGVILNVTPVIHSGGRIDLDVSQEVSTVGSAGLGGSPNISTRRIQTKLTVSDGNTLLLGGLMREERTEGNSGIPMLKDIPVLGNVFRTTVDNAVRRTELVILLTPYVVEDDFDAAAITESFRNQFSWSRPMTTPAMRPQQPATPTEGETRETIPPPAHDAPPAQPQQPASASDASIGETAGTPTEDAALTTPSAVTSVTPPDTPEMETGKKDKYRSRPYHLPPISEEMLQLKSDGWAQSGMLTTTTPDQDAAAPPTARPTTPEDITTSPETPATAADVTKPETGQPVENEALRQELLNLLKQ